MDGKMMEMDTLRGTITYPTLGKPENQFQKLRLVGDMLVPNKNLSTFLK